MKITVKLFSLLRQNRFHTKELTFPEGSSVQVVLDSLSITREEMEIGIIFINGLHGTFESRLSDGDTLSLFPPAAGG